MPTYNYAARDDLITSQTYAPVSKLSGLPRDLFMTYWRDVHGPLCSRLPGLGFYVQHHMDPADSANLWPFPEGIRHMDAVLDGTAELGFANRDDEAAFVEASPILFGDEFNLFRHVLAYYLPNGSKTYLDRQADGVPNGPDKIYRLHLHLNGSGDENFKRWARKFVETLASSDLVWKLRLHLPDQYDNAHPAPPSPGVDHFATDERLGLVAIEIGWETVYAARQFFESDLYKSTVEGFIENVKSMSVHKVAAVYTYVRDGKPTIAGLRGSRQAEIIEKIGALNQTTDEVGRLFVRG